MRHLYSTSAKYSFVFFMGLLCYANFQVQDPIEELTSADFSSTEKNPVEASLAQKINGLNAVAAAVNAGNQTPELRRAECTTGDCYTRAQDYQFEQCDRNPNSPARNDFLELQIEKIRTTEIGSVFSNIAKSRPDIPTIIRPECVQSAMELAPYKDSNRVRNGVATNKQGQRSGGFSAYRACEPGMDRTNNKEFRPCVSESYVNLSANAFNLAGACMTHVPSSVLRTAAILYPHESGFHINVIRPGGNDSGPGQLLSAAIEDVNRFALPALRQNLARHESQICKNIGTEIINRTPPMRSQNQFICDRVNLDKGNPLTNYIYSIEVLRLKQQRIEDAAFKPYAQAFSKLSERDMARLKEAVLIYAYNLGESVASAVVSCLKTYGPPNSFNEFIQHFKSSIRGHVRANAGWYRYNGMSDEELAYKKSNYLDDVVANFRAMEKNARGGRACLRK